MDDRKHPDDTVAEEASALGQRVKGATKDAVGAVTGNDSLEREGERENAAGRARQANNDVLDETDGVPQRSVGDNQHLVTGLYDSPETAGKAYNDLTTKHGYRPDDISVVMSDETRKQHFGDVRPGTELKEGSKASQGAGVGGSIGIGVGAALGAFVAAATAIAIPGVGVIIAGPIAGAIAGAGAGAATGGLLGALIGAGIPEERATEYETGIKQGGILMGTRARDVAHAATLERDFSEYGARNILLR